MRLLLSDCLLIAILFIVGEQWSQHVRLSGFTGLLFNNILNLSLKEFRVNFVSFKAPQHL